MPPRMGLRHALLNPGWDRGDFLIRLPDKRPKSSNKEFRKAGKEACKFILPAFLPSSFIFV
jgi:hypothetical protein